MTVTFTFTDLLLWGEHRVTVEVDLECVDFGEAPAAASLSYPGDPGSPPEYEIEEIRLTSSDIEDVVLSETQFIFLIENGSDIVNNAYEYASEQPIERDYDDDY